MSDAYRETTLLCPVCSLALDARMLKDAEVDVCGHCKGIWIDWFDGDLGQVAMQASPMSVPMSVIAPATSAACPHCRRSMTLQPYGETGLVSLWRCGECAGAFIPRGSFESLLELAQMEPPRSEHPDAPSPLARVLALLRRLVTSPAPPAEKA
jgi:Zn-finger nucleic acid-binding protein